jgi:hypothetical protein
VPPGRMIDEAVQRQRIRLHRAGRRGNVHICHQGRLLTGIRA